MAPENTSFNGRLIEVGPLFKTTEQIPVVVDCQAIALVDPAEYTDTSLGTYRTQNQTIREILRAECK